MTGRTPRTLVVLASILAVMAGTSCKKTQTTPSPIETTETFTGTIQPGGASSHAFNVNYQYSYTDAYFTVQSLKSVADGSDKNITIGVGYGAINIGVCTRIASVSNPTAPFNSEVPSQGGTFGPGGYCIQIYDNPDAPTVTEALTYSLKLRHF